MGIGSRLWGSELRRRWPRPWGAGTVVGRSPRPGQRGQSRRLPLSRPPEPCRLDFAREEEKLPSAGRPAEGFLATLCCAHGRTVGVSSTGLPPAPLGSTG